MSNKTAMQQLIEELELIKRTKTKTLQEVVFFDGVLSIIEGKFLATEKQQIIEVYETGKEHERTGTMLEMYQTGEQYYTQTFGNSPSPSN